MSWKSLTDIYLQEAAGKNLPKLPRQQVIGEDDQRQLFRTVKSGKNKGDEVTVSDKDQMSGKFDVDDKKKLKLDDKDIEAFNSLSYEDQMRVKKYIDGSANRQMINNTFTGSEKYLDLAYKNLMSSGMSSNDIQSVLRDAQDNKAVNSSKLSTVGNYTPLEIFSGEASYEAFKLLMTVGEKDLQQGPGEVAFTMLSKDVSEQTKGDISINGEIYELKVNGGRIGDKAGPDPGLIRNIISKYLGDMGKEHFQNIQSLSTKKFVEFVNNAKAQDIETDNMVKEIYSHILNPEYADKMVAAYQGKTVNPENAIRAFKEHSFDYYKSTKTGDGEWNKLIGINTKHSNGSIAVIETGMQFADTPMQTANPAIVRTKSGTRENYIEFKPLQG